MFRRFFSSQPFSHVLVRRGRRGVASFHVHMPVEDVGEAAAWALHFGACLGDGECSVGPAVERLGRLAGRLRGVAGDAGHGHVVPVMVLLADGERRGVLHGGGRSARDGSARREGLERVLVNLDLKKADNTFNRREAQEALETLAAMDPSSRPLILAHHAISSQFNLIY